MNKLIRLNEVKNLTGLSRSSIYQFIAEDEFPKQVKLGARAVAWLECEIQSWIDNKISGRRA